jgi:hypothetical protein
MIQPQSLNVLPGAGAEDLYVWAIQGRSGKYLAIPDPRYPGRRPIRFFTSQVGATRMLHTVLELKPALEKQNLVVVEVRLHVALEKAVADTTPPLADSYVINNPDEVVEFVIYLRNKDAGKV